MLEIGTPGPVSLISNIYLVVTDNFQYYLELVGNIQCLDFQDLISKATGRTVIKFSGSLGPTEGLLQLHVRQNPATTLKAVVAHLCAPPGTRMSRVTMGQVSGTLPDMWRVCRTRRSDVDHRSGYPGAAESQLRTPPSPSPTSAR